jgi:hypothetical protein
MKRIFKIERCINYLITKSVIALHEDGYIYDFLLDEVGRLWAIQERRPYLFTEININKINKFDDHDGNATKFIVAIETVDGLKGVLLSTRLNQDFLNYIKDGVKTEMLQ